MQYTLTLRKKTESYLDRKGFATSALILLVDNVFCHNILRALKMQIFLLLALDQAAEI